MLNLANWCWSGHWFGIAAYLSPHHSIEAGAGMIAINTIINSLIQWDDLITVTDTQRLDQDHVQWPHAVRSSSDAELI